MADAPQILFSWPSDVAAKAAKSEPPIQKRMGALLPGLYKMTFFDLPLNQPIGREAWILVVSSESFKASSLLYDTAKEQTASWPKGTTDASERYTRAFMEYLADPAMK